MCATQTQARRTPSIARRLSSRGRRSALPPSAKRLRRDGRLTLATCSPAVRWSSGCTTRPRRLRLMPLLRFSFAYSCSSRLRSHRRGKRRRGLTSRSHCVLFLLCLAPPRTTHPTWRPPATTRSSPQRNAWSTRATGEPIPRAMVTLMGSPMRYAFSDSNGSFTIEGVPAGRYSRAGAKAGLLRPAGGRGLAFGSNVEVGPTATPW